MKNTISMQSFSPLLVRIEDPEFRRRDPVLRYLQSPFTGCWNWPLKQLPPKLGKWTSETGMTSYGVRPYLWKLVTGKAPRTRLRVTCGNLKCVRPDHLEYGGRFGVMRKTFKRSKA